MPKSQPVTDAELSALIERALDLVHDLRDAAKRGVTYTNMVEFPRRVKDPGGDWPITVPITPAGLEALREVEGR